MAPLWHFCPKKVVNKHKNPDSCETFQGTNRVGVRSVAPVVSRIEKNVSIGQARNGELLSPARHATQKKGFYKCFGTGVASCNIGKIKVLSLR